VAGHSLGRLLGVIHTGSNDWEPRTSTLESVINTRPPSDHFALIFQEPQPDVLIVCGPEHHPVRLVRIEYLDCSHGSPHHEDVGRIECLVYPNLYPVAHGVDGPVRGMMWSGVRHSHDSGIAWALRCEHHRDVVQPVAHTPMVHTHVLNRGGLSVRSPLDWLAVGRGTLGEAGRARAHMALRARLVLEPCQGARVDPAAGWGGQVVETAWVLVRGLRGFHEVTEIHLRHRWRANFAVVRHEWRELARRKSLREAWRVVDSSGSWAVHSMVRGRCGYG
jgi:hypothetical protein